MVEKMPSTTKSSQFEAMTIVITDCERLRLFANILQSKVFNATGYSWDIAQSSELEKVIKGSNSIIRLEQDCNATVGYIVESSHGSDGLEIRICGNTERGVLTGIYRFLREFNTTIARKQDIKISSSHMGHYDATYAHEKKRRNPVELTMW
uniref:Uncharacterized protein n=1 Tax=Mucochytrium quahogii TaxID=96639 RepID=A0A7S2SPM4_9STRA|mmetsp:Transcript_47/g.121  ORF Transcript_47/g.121 Transcript_47/m.121 type:complete len:151 (-) Transcript_47:209-661(-)